MTRKSGSLAALLLSLALASCAGQQQDPVAAGIEKTTTAIAVGTQVVVGLTATVEAGFTPTARVYYYYDVSMERLIPSDDDFPKGVVGERSVSEVKTSYTIPGYIRETSRSFASESSNNTSIISFGWATCEEYESPDHAWSGWMRQVESELLREIAPAPGGEKNRTEITEIELDDIGVSWTAFNAKEPDGYYSTIVVQYGPYACEYVAFNDSSPPMDELLEIVRKVLERVN